MRFALARRVSRYRYFCCVEGGGWLAGLKPGAYIGFQKVRWMVQFCRALGTVVLTEWELGS
jgi:hypothetical protein